MNLLWVPFAGGVLAFAHCLGMCGGFVLHFARAGDHRRSFVCQLHGTRGARRGWDVTLGAPGSVGASHGVAASAPGGRSHGGIESDGTGEFHALAAFSGHLTGGSGRS